MDFNNIFNRAPSDAGLADRFEGGGTLDEWEHFLTQIYPLGRTQATLIEVKVQHTRLGHLVRNFANQAQKIEPNYVRHQLYLLGGEVAGALRREDDTFIQSNRTVEDPESLQYVKEADVFVDLLRPSVKDDHQKILGICSYLNGLQISLGPQGSKGSTKPQKDRLILRVSELHQDLSTLQTVFSKKYERLELDAKQGLPRRAWYLVDKVVELFVTSPIEAAILHIRRHNPGAIGAFYGLEE